MLAIGIVIINFPPFSIAEEQYEFNFDQVVVTSSKVPQTEKDVTQKMDIIDYDEINRTVLYNKNISEILYYTPGFAVNVLSRNDANWALPPPLPPFAFVATASSLVWPAPPPPPM